MAITLERIHYFPVKGLRGEALDAVTLAPHEGLPHDRRFAVARGDTAVDPAVVRWLPKQKLVMLMRDVALARVECRLDLGGRTVELRAPGLAPCVAPFASAEGRARLDAYVNQTLGVRPEGRARWIEAGAASFTDVPQNCLSLINVESVRELETRMGAALDPLRFRGNLWMRGAAPWAEFDWVGRDVRVGAATLRIAARIPRCAATAVNPATGERDVNVVKGLRAAYGHHDMGVYAEVVGGGRIACGDVITPPGNPRARGRIGHWLRFYGFLARSVPMALRRRRV